MSSGASGVLRARCEELMRTSRNWEGETGIRDTETNMAVYCTNS